MYRQAVMAGGDRIDPWRDSSRQGPRPCDPIDEALRNWEADVSPRAAQAYALCTRILYVSRLIEASFERQVRGNGLNIGESLVLDTLRRLGPPYETTAARLKDHFLISFAGIGKRLIRLEALGFVTRRVDPEDRRSQIVGLTPQGLHLVQSDADSVEPSHTRAVQMMDGGDVDQLMDLLRTLQQRIEAQRPEE